MITDNEEYFTKIYEGVIEYKAVDVDNASGYEDIRNLLPLHPRCRCTYLPVVGNPILQVPIGKGPIETSPIEIIGREHKRPLRGDAVYSVLKNDFLKNGIKLTNEEAKEIIENGVKRFSGNMNCTNIRLYQNCVKSLGHNPTPEEWLKFINKEDIINMPNWQFERPLYEKSLLDWNKESTLIEKFINNSPDFKNETGLFRAMGGMTKEVKESFANIKFGDIIDLKGTSSFTSSITHSKEFLSDNGYILIIKGNAKNSASVSYLSNTPGEFEVLLSNKNKYKVTNMINNINYSDIPEVVARKNNLANFKDDLLFNADLNPGSSYNLKDIEKIAVNNFNEALEENYKINCIYLEVVE